jgi:hypothetical protein
MTILVQNQTIKQFGPFLINLPKARLQIFHTIFFGPFHGLRHKFWPLGNTGEYTLHCTPRQNCTQLPSSCWTPASPFTQCCQLLEKMLGQINQKIWLLAKKFGPSESILTQVNIISFFSKIHNAK